MAVRIHRLGGAAARDSRLKRAGLALALLLAACAGAPQIEWIDPEHDAALLNIADPASPALDIVRATADSRGGRLTLSLWLRPSVRTLTHYRSPEGAAFGAEVGRFQVRSGTETMTIALELGFKQTKGYVTGPDELVAAADAKTPAAEAWVYPGASLFPTGKLSQVLPGRFSGHRIEVSWDAGKAGWKEGNRLAIRFHERPNRYDDPGWSEEKTLTLR